MKTVTPETQQSVQRVRVGMIGLAAVLLLIGLASAIFATVSQDRPVEVVGGARASTVANIAGDGTLPSDSASPNEPLAELGVAPSTGNSSATAPRPTRK